ncbi:MAG: AbrB/MazE/SpoVT family DNA-binding domain-containing protein [Elusimicrobia bacterium]|nr:AbrB/MazE/SpoVT family DNA-binding domain-containing protein [Elusimicrobiota bacterium]
MLSKRTSKNQVTIPKEIITFFGDTEYFDVSLRNNEIVLKPVEINPQGQVLADVREKIRKLGLSEKDVERAVRWARRRSA